MQQQGPFAQTAEVPFVDRWSFQSRAVYAHEVSAYHFLVESDIGALKEYTRRYFFEPSGGQIDLQPVSSHVLLQISSTERLDGGDEPYPRNYPDLGPEHSAGLLFFAVDKNNDDAFVLAMPYLIVDNPISMMLAREAFGIPKNMGSITAPPAQPDPDVIGVDVLGVTDVTAPSARYEILPLMRVRRVDDLEQRILNFATGLEAAFMRPASGVAVFERGLLELLDLGGLGAHSLGILVSGQFRLLCLKQFRDEVNNTLAAYQKVVALESTIQKRNGFRLLNGRYQVSFSDVASHPLAGDLGLSGVRDSRLSFWMGYDFSITGVHYP